MKITDDYRAKYRLWAGNPSIMPAPEPVRLSEFKSQRFSPHVAMNDWKRSLLRQWAEQATRK